MKILNTIKNLFNNSYTRHIPLSEPEARWKCAIGNLPFVKSQMESYMRIYNIEFTYEEKENHFSYTYEYNGIEQPFPDGCMEDDYIMAGEAIAFYPKRTNLVGQTFDIISYMKYKRKGRIDVSTDFMENLFGIYHLNNKELI